MTTQKAIIIGSIIIAVGVFLSAQRLAYVESFEGKFYSCVNTYGTKKVADAVGIAPEQAMTLCLVRLGQGGKL